MTKKKKRKPVSYKTIKLKLTKRQRKSLENFCRSRGTTPIKVIKKSIKPLLNNYAAMSSGPRKMSAKQLDLFGTD
jgi:hypothetical protein